jgi:hypothetical protein
VFAVERRATDLRAGAPGVVVGLLLDVRLARAGLARSLAPYVDAVRVVEAGPRDAEVARWFPGAELWRDAVGEGVMAAVGAPGRVVLHAPDAVRAAREVAALAPLLVPGLTPLDEAQFSCEGCRVSTFLHPDSLHAIAIVASNTPFTSIHVPPRAERATAVDLEAPAPAAGVPLSGGVATLPAPARRVVVDVEGWRATGEEAFADVVRVSAARTLTAAEIVARHQAWRARQSALVRTAITAGTTVITFDVPGFAGPATVTASTRTFTRGPLVEMEQRDIRMNGVDLGVDGGAPKLPIIEPERVMTPPLAIALGAAYEYRLAGRERVGGRDCHVLAFAPRVAGGASFEGRAWIEASSFALVRMDAVQTGLRGAIVSARQRDELGPVAVGDREAWLPVRSTSDQVYQAAGFRTPIHREVVTTSHEVNPADFDARREAAFRAREVILRDTPRGFEYLVPARRCAEPGVVCATEALRTPAERSGRRVLSLVFGVLDDPNISVPLPYAGLSFLDFDLLGRGIQFSGFFGGTYGQAAWAVPGVFRPGWQFTGRAFGIAASYNDRSFRDGLERYDENVLQRPAHVEASLVVPVTPRAQVRVGYELDYTAFRAGADTADDFRVPADAVVHGARLGLDVQRGAWSALAWWNPAWRQGWRRWGRPGGEGDRGGSTFQRYGVTVARSWAFSPGRVARVEGSWVDGHGLDRFSRYTVDGFDNRLRGYPSASLRYDRGAILRGVATWAPIGRVRLDGFADLAAVHDPGFGNGLEAYPGLGATAEIPLPARCLLAFEWGYGVEARTTDGRRGTHVVRLSGIKVF